MDLYLYRPQNATRLRLMPMSYSATYRSALPETNLSISLLNLPNFSYSVRFAPTPGKASSFSQLFNCILPSIPKERNPLFLTLQNQMICISPARDIHASEDQSPLEKYYNPSKELHLN